MPLTPHQLASELQRIGYPKTYEVTPATYEAAEQEVLDWLKRQGKPQILKVGPHGGIYFKGVELILVKP